MSKTKLRNIQNTLLYFLGLSVDESEDTKASENSLSDETVVNGMPWKELKHTQNEEDFFESEFSVSQLMPSLTVIPVEIDEL